MPKLEGTLTGAQLEIIEAVWAGRPEGSTVAEIRRRLSRKRDLARTTVLTLVGRLEQRGWLLRKRDGRAYRYRAARSRDQATGRLAAEFVNAFFGGSASQLVMSLLGSDRLGEAELERLRRVLDEAEKEGKP